jgi:hypothetical protein
MREDAVSAFLARVRADWLVVHKLIAQGQLIETQFEGRKFYVMRLH